MNSELDI